MIEKRFRSISHLMNEEDQVKTATQWTQRLQSHLEAKTLLGPSTHEKQIRRRTLNISYDGEGSIQDVFTTNPRLRDRDNNSSSARLQNSMSNNGDIAGGWLSAPTKRTSSRHGSSSNINGSYSQLDNTDNSKKQSTLNKLLQSKSKSPCTLPTNNNDSKSILFPPPPDAVDSLLPDVGSSSSFSGINEFMNMSSGPLNTNLLELNASSEFTILRQAQEKGSESPKRSYTPPVSRKSLFGSGQAKSVLGPNLAKQFTEFRLRRNGRGARPEKEEEANFSVTSSSEKPSGRGGMQDLDTGKSAEDLEDPANENSKQYVRKLNASGEFQHVDNMSSNQLQRPDLQKEIELRREKFKRKLAGLEQKANKVKNLKTVFAQDLHGSVKETQKDEELSMAPSLTLEALQVNPTGRRPTRSQSSSAAELKKGHFSSGTWDSIAFMAEMFDDDDDAFFATATTGKNLEPQIAPTSEDAPALKKQLPSFSIPEAAALQTRSKTLSDLDAKPFEGNPFTTVTPPKAVSNTNEGTGAQNETGTSNRSERSNTSEGSKGSKKGDSTAPSSGRSERSAVSMRPRSPARLRRRATVHVSAGVDLDQSFQIHDGEFVLNTRDKEEKHESSFSSKPEKSTTKAFHQSFAIESLASDTKRNEHSHGSSMPINTTAMPSLFEIGTFLMGTVNEASQHSATKRPKRRNSLPTGSSHGSSKPAKNSLCAPSINKPILLKSKSTDDGERPKATPRRSRRPSFQVPDLKESFAELRLGGNLDTEDPPLCKSKSAASVVTAATSSTAKIGTEEEEQILAATQMMGLSPHPADAAPRRRTSVSHAPPAPDHQPDKTVEKIRARRRESTRVSSRNEKSKLRMKDNSEPAISSRRKDRKSSRRRTASVERASAGLKRGMTADGKTTSRDKAASRSRTPTGTRRKGSDEMNDESRKKRSGRISTVSAARRSRRASMELGSTTPKTPRSARKSSSEGLYKPRPRSPKPNFGIISSSTPRVRSLNRGMEDGSQKWRKAAMDDGSQISRSNRRSGRPPSNRQGSIDVSDEEMSDDSDYVPTPKPAAPPSLPTLATRRSGAVSSRGVGSALSPRRKTSKSKPRRHRSDFVKRTERDADLPDLISPSAERRKMRNRRHVAHETVKEGSENSTPAADTAQGVGVPAGSEVLHSPVQDSGRAKKTVDRKLVADLCKSPNKAHRFRRHKAANSNEEAQNEEAITKSPSGRCSRKARRAKSDEARKAVDPSKSPKTPSSLRRRNTETNGEGTAVRKLRRTKTVESTLPSINLEEDIDTNAAERKEAAACKGRGDAPNAVPELDGNASNRFMLKGISF